MKFIKQNLGQNNVNPCGVDLKKLFWMDDHVAVTEGGNGRPIL